MNESAARITLSATDYEDRTSDLDELPPLLGGDLNPLSGFYFPLFSMVFPWGISIRVAICRKEWNQNCRFLSSIYVQFLHVF